MPAAVRHHMQGTKSFHSSSSTTLCALTFSRTWLAAVAKENMEIAESGTYFNMKGAEVDISDALKTSVKNTKHYHYTEEVIPPELVEAKDTKIYVCYALCVKAALALKKAGAKHVGMLNSADGYRPGGKFGTGTLSLEACICRGTLLWPTLKQFEDKRNKMYKTNNSSSEFKTSPSACAIYSPNVPVIRKDSLQANFLDAHEECSIVSLPPPNAFAVGGGFMLKRTMKERLHRSLSIFAENGCTDLVLCSYGCGTRGNDPSMVATIYNELLTNEFKGYFNRVIFSINPKKHIEYDAFASVFEENNETL
jgi:uncharacterized protein (TIGR02452 family)